MKKEFRSFYQNIVDLILNKKTEINTFIRKSLKATGHVKGTKKHGIKKMKSKSKKNR